MAEPRAQERAPEVPPAAQPRALERLRADLQRYLRPELRSPWQKARALLETEAVWAISIYRLGQYLQEEAPRPLRQGLRVPYGLLMRAAHLALGIHLYPDTRIGPGLYIGHHGGIWISPGAKLGAGCNVNHGATIGTAGRAAPSLGDRVWVGPGAVITGPVRVGAEVVVGANSLVTGNVPERAVVLGVPARIISYSGSARLLGRSGARPLDKA